MSERNLANAQASKEGERLNVENGASGVESVVVEARLVLCTALRQDVQYFKSMTRQPSLTLLF
jgi:hypothetical protein